MKRSLVIAILAVAAIGLSNQQASAQFPANYGFQPWGFYMPYGSRFGTSIKTPPYFATNPPVYYGARHARPYGLSPFASPPLVTPGNDYRTRLRSDFLEPVRPTPQPTCNPCVSHSKTIKKAKSNQVVKKGSVQVNPFVVSETDKIAKK